MRSRMRFTAYEYDGPVERDEQVGPRITASTYSAAMAEWRRLLRSGDLVCGVNCPLNDIGKCTGRCY